MTGRARVACARTCDRLRRFAISILVLAIGAFVLQAPAHASPARHAQHRAQAATPASHSARHPMPNDHGADRSTCCVNDDSGLVLVDCCQACVVTAIPVEPLALGASMTGEVFVGLRADPVARSPEAILRPPRLIAL